MSDVANEYGQGLYLLACEEETVDGMLTEVRDVCALFAEEPDYRTLLATPTIPREERLALLDAAFEGRVMPHLLSFLKLMTERGYASEIPMALAAFIDAYRAAAGMTVAEVVSAVPLTEGERADLIARLSRMTGKTVELSLSVDADLLGGMRVTVDGKLYDGTVKGRLARIGQKLNDQPI